jgi:hypothetical protein
MNFFFITREIKQNTLLDISAATSMTVEDVCNTLVQQNMIFIREPTPPIVRPSPGQSIKFPKGRKNGVGRRHLQRLQSSHTPTYDGSSHSPTPKTNGHSNGGHEPHDTNKGPFVAPKHYEIRFEREKVEVYLRKWESKGYVRLKPEKLQWTPYLVTRSTQEVLPKVDLPAMDTLPVVEDGGSKEGEVVTPATESVVVVVSEPPTEPVTPAATTVATRSGEDLPREEEEKDDVMPMLVDTVIVEEPRARTRSEKEPSAPKSLCSSPPPPTGRSLRTRGDEAMMTRSGRRRPSKDEEEVTPSRPGRKRRRIDSSPEDEEVIETAVVVVKWEEDPGLLGDSDADGEYELDDTEFVM